MPRVLPQVRKDPGDRRLTCLLWSSQETDFSWAQVKKKKITAVVRVPPAWTDASQSNKDREPRGRSPARVETERDSSDSAVLRL